MFRRLQHFGIKVKLDKCRFFKESVDYLGHTISCQGLAPTKERIAGIVQAQAPSNKVELNSFLGLMTYNCRFFTISLTGPAPSVSNCETGNQMEVGTSPSPSICDC